MILSSNWLFLAFDSKIPVCHLSLKLTCSQQWKLLWMRPWEERKFHHCEGLPTCTIIKKKWWQIYFLLWNSKAGNHSKKFKIWFEISSTQKRQNRPNSPCGAGRKWESLAVVLTGTLALRCHREKLCVSWQDDTCGTSSDETDQQWGPRIAAAVSLTEQTPPKWAQSRSKHGKVYNKMVPPVLMSQPK